MSVCLNFNSCRLTKCQALLPKVYHVLHPGQSSLFGSWILPSPQSGFWQIIGCLVSTCGMHEFFLISHETVILHLERGKTKGLVTWPELRHCCMIPFLTHSRLTHSAVHGLVSFTQCLETQALSMTLLQLPSPGLKINYAPVY